MSEAWIGTLLEPLRIVADRVTAVLPNLFVMSLLLVGGVVAAWVVGTLLERSLRVVGLDRLCDRVGVTAALLRGGVKTDPSRIVGRVGYWAVLGFAGMAAISALQLQPINQATQSFLAYIPHVISALLIGGAGYLLSNFVSQAVLIAAVNAGVPPARLLAACARWGVLLVAASMAMEQLGIAEHVVVVGFGIMFGGIVLAATLAFGLGARDLAKTWLEAQFYGRDHRRPPDDLRHL
ncbi:MAG: hypothetical protein U0172_07245 [Nitrospiraceae bacterium]